MKNYKGGYSKYQKDLLPFIIEYVTPILNERSKGKIAYRSQGDFSDKITSGFLEISKTFDSLQLSKQFIKIAPPKSKKITKDEYIEYHVQHYLQEVYILKERLVKYAKHIMRIYKNILNKEGVESTIKSLITLVEKSLKNIIDVRGEHVHDTRYIDKTIQDLKLFSLSSQHDEKFIKIEKISYTTAKNKWKAKLKTFNQDIEQLLDIYFGTLHLIVFKDGKVLTPNKY